uniref:Pseudouridine synthase n=1 Tax=Prevotella sp. GTC17254 TaxID=3236794 RepID=A0AB33IVT3_9BACT
MEFENENNNQNLSSEQNESGREGYGSQGSYSRDYHSTGRSQRPRIHTQRAYSSERGSMNGGHSEGGFRPEGFGMGLQGNAQGGQQRPYQPRQQQGGYRPRYNNNGEGGYQPRQQGGYRPRYNNNGEGGYQPRQQQGGYRPRYNNNGEGGYQPRQQGGYQPRYNNNGEEGGYQPRQQGGYNNRGGYNNNRGGYGNNRGGYGYNNRGGYGNNNHGGYNNRGGYGNQGGYRQHTLGYDPNAKYSLKKRIEYKEEHIDPNEPIRLNKFLANAGVCSRREADEFIQAGVVTVNGNVVTELGTKVLRTDEVKFHDQNVSLEKKVYVLLNKPKDTVTTSDDPQQRKTVMDLVKDACPERIYPVGRLDRNTTGVLLLTNDGDLASKLTHPKFLKKKVYHVYLDKNVTAHDIQQIADGIELEDGEVHADAIEYADERDKSQIGIEIHSGKNRIVRRIFESLGYRVVKLDRVQFAGLTKKNLRRGDWRFLTEKEVEMLRMGAFE